jgi:hypothetical protein
MIQRVSPLQLPLVKEVTQEEAQTHEVEEHSLHPLTQEVEADVTLRVGTHLQIMTMHQLPRTRILAVVYEEPELMALAGAATPHQFTPDRTDIQRRQSFFS